MLTVQSLLALEALVASITIRNLDERVKARLRIRAARHGRSMEEEARMLLRAALKDEEPAGRHLVAAIRARFAPLGGVDLPAPAREAIRVPPRPGR
jgi:plasmid stability protein